MVATPIKKHLRPAALKKRIDKLKIQLQQLEETYAESTKATPGEAEPSSHSSPPQPPPPADEDGDHEDEQ